MPHNRTIARLVQIGLHVAKLRRSKMLTQRALALNSGISLRQVQGIESGAVDIRLSTLERISEILGIQSFEFLVPEIIAGGKLQAVNHELCASRIAQTCCPLDSLPVALQICDTRGKICFVSSVCEGILGYSRQEVSRKVPIWDFLKMGEEKADLDRFLSYLMDKRPRPRPFTMKNADSNKRLIEVRVDWSYIMGIDSTIAGFAMILIPK